MAAAFAAVALQALPGGLPPTGGPPRPLVGSVSPDRGPTAGGTRVVVNGNYFSRDAKVTFDDVPALETYYVSDDRLEAVTPPHEPGAANVSVLTYEGRLSGGRARAFTFVAP